METEVEPAEPGEAGQVGLAPVEPEAPESPEAPGAPETPPGRRKRTTTFDNPFGSVENWPVDHSEQANYDGRLLKGERTRRAIAAAMIDLIDEGDPSPTTRMIAERAGVSLRLVFHHFPHVDAMFVEAADIQLNRHWSRMGPIASSLPLAERIDRTCRQRRRLFAAITPVPRAACSRVSEAPTIREGLAASRAWLRRRLASTFEPEILRSGDGGEQLLDALELAAGWEAWSTLRDGSRTLAATEQVMAFALTRLLS